MLPKEDTVKSSTRR
uniref:Uncharacterized protein n=1 Tax=Arundo donax TaxID=35708 RepID=A0A0A9EM97_ARUDO